MKFLKVLMIVGCIVASPFMCLPLVNLILGSSFNWRLFLIGVGILAACVLPYEELKARRGSGS
jgi:hypothetical protein